MAQKCRFPQVAEAINAKFLNESSGAYTVGETFPENHRPGTCRRETKNAKSRFVVTTKQLLAAAILASIHDREKRSFAKTGFGTRIRTVQSGRLLLSAGGTDVARAHKASQAGQGMALFEGQKTVSSSDDFGLKLVRFTKTGSGQT